MSFSEAVDSMPLIKLRLSFCHEERDSPCPSFKRLNLASILFMNWKPWMYLIAFLLLINQNSLLRLNSLGPIAHICAHLFQTFGAHSAYMRASSSPSSKEDASVYATAVYHRQSQDRQYYNNKLFSAAKTGQSPCL